MPLLLAVSALGFVSDDDDVPDITGRVARVTFVDGDVQVRRSGAQDWEKVVQNLPLVEGDEIATDPFGKAEVQFDTHTFLRIQERSVVRITTLKDEGIALSVPQGTVSIRLTDFDKDRSYFEIDIPNSTVAFQKAGFYRIDVGDKDSIEARVRVTDGGEARIYSETSGFSLRNGRAATIFLSGNNVGEWDTADASAFMDSFDNWTLDRDKVIAKRLSDAYYDKYYDRDMYGAEDLDGYGEWVYTKKYGYVWKPFRSSLVNYGDWSPYRYGHWRWVPPYGWTWINDEPWGWATYHYGRWVWDSGFWYWTPYGYYRYRRSWWSPALVVINIFNNNVCWYPLGYYHRYHNYYGGRRRDRDYDRPRPNASPTPTVAQTNDRRTVFSHTPANDIPPGGVVTIPVDEWGRLRNGNRRASIDVARTILSRDPETIGENPPILPPVERVNQKISKEIRPEAPPIIAMATRTVKTGAAERTTDRPLDEDLRRSRIFGNRPPLEVQNPPPSETRTETPAAQTPVERPRPTGAVTRPEKPRVESPVNQGPPIVVPPVSTEPPTRREQPRYEQPKVEQPRVETPRRVERSEPPQPRVEQPRRETPKVEPPTRRDEPKPAPRSDPPPQKSEPKPDKPSPPLANSGRKKDG
jgi:hypothetical protein